MCVCLSVCSIYCLNDNYRITLQLHAHRLQICKPLITWPVLHSMIKTDLMRCKLIKHSAYPHTSRCESQKAAAASPLYPVHNILYSQRHAFKMCLCLFYIRQLYWSLWQNFAPMCHMSWQAYKHLLLAMCHPLSEWHMPHMWLFNLCHTCAFLYIFQDDHAGLCVNECEKYHSSIPNSSNSNAHLNLTC